MKTTDFNSEIKKYTIIQNNNKLEFNAYSLVGFIDDLHKALFLETEFPWSAPKYEKKIHRYTFFILILAYNKYENVNVKAFSENLRNYLKSLKTDNVDLEKIKNFNLKLKTNEKIFVKDEKYLFEMISCLNKLKNKVNKTEEINTFNKLLDIVIELIGYFITDLENNNFTDIETKYDKESENVPFLEKYLKYKQKYLNLRALIK
jgi:hypothetical protein